MSVSTSTDAVIRSMEVMLEAMVEKSMLGALCDINGLSDMLIESELVPSVGLDGNMMRPNSVVGESNNCFWASDSDSIVVEPLHMISLCPCKIHYKEQSI